MSGLWLYLRYAARMFTKKPGFAAATVLTLGLGVGAATAIFSVVYGVLLKPLPFEQPEQLVSLVHRGPSVQIPFMNHGPATYFTAHDHQRVFEDVGAWESEDITVTGVGEPEALEALNLTANVLPILRVRPLIGRAFTAQEDVAGQPLRVLLTHGYWQRRFGASDVIGRTLQVDGRSAEIIGVLPASFKFLDKQPSLVLPMQLDRADAAFIQFDFEALGRLKPGVTLEQANADMARWLTMLPPVFKNLPLGASVRPLSHEVIGDVGRLLWILQAAVAVVLLIACANVVNLFLVRIEGRQQELALRTALGASRRQIARALLSESFLLALAGGVIGLLLAQGVITLLRQIAPGQLPRVSEIALDPIVLLVGLLLSIASGLLFGLVNLMRSQKAALASIKEGSRWSSDGRDRHRTRNTLVVAQIALALTLMIVSGLMMRTVLALRAVDPGFSRPETVQLFTIALPRSELADLGRFAQMHRSISERIAAIPGVSSVGLSSSITMDGEDNLNTMVVENAPPLRTGERSPGRRLKALGPGYFQSMGITLAAGRDITWEDIQQNRPVILVSQAFARDYWPDAQSAIGKRIRADFGATDAPWREIIGVVSDERDDGLTKAPTAIVYWPLVNGTYDRRAISYAVRTERAGSAALMREIERAVWAVNPNAPIANAQKLEQIVARSMARTSFAMVMLGIAAGVSLLLGIIGIYGVIAYVAAQRTREIGIRMALGARIADIRAMFLRQGVLLTVTGLAIGLFASLVLTRMISTLLFGVAPLDPVTYGITAVALATVALLATYLPARHASRVDPLVALTHM